MYVFFIGRFVLNACQIAICLIFSILSAVFVELSIYSGVTAFIAGLVSSVHCVAMCGPLSCAFLTSSINGENPHIILISYHISKLIGYSLVGALAGAFGGILINILHNSWLSYLPWILVIFFLTIAFRLDRFYPKPLWLVSIYQKISSKKIADSPVTRAAVFGFISPLLPCGPLYMILGLALFSGSALEGAEFAAGFGVGTMPLLWLAQSQLFRLQKSLTISFLSMIQRAVAFCAAIVLMWRLRATLGIESTIDWICQ